MIFFDAWKSWKQPPQFVWACKMRRKVVYSQREKLSKTSGKNLEFSVEITKTALTDAEEYVYCIRDDRQDPTVAEQWWNGLIDQILSLEALQKRCPIIPEHYSGDACLRYFRTVLRSMSKYWAISVTLQPSYRARRLPGRHRRGSGPNNTYSLLLMTHRKAHGRPTTGRQYRYAPGRGPRCGYGQLSLTWPVAGDGRVR